MKKAFISHSSPNDRYVQEMVQYLRKLGYDEVFNDAETILPDEEFWPCIEQGILACDAFVLILSRASVKSPWVAQEIAFARLHQKKIIPIRIEDCDLPPEFQKRDVIELRHDATHEAKPNNLPYNPLGSLFKGRKQFLVDMRERLTSSKHAAVITTKPQAVFGAGGVGKTRTAIEYAWQYAKEYTALLFVSADSADRLEANLANLVGVLALADCATKSDPEKLAAVLAWLQTHREWLVIIDNVDTEDAVQAVREKLAALANGHVIITSRISKWSGSVQPLELDLLEVPDARDYLLEKTQQDRRPTANDATDAEAIALLVGQLALGLEHAAAYINANRLTLAKYIQRWNEQQATILNSFDRLAIDYPKEILVTWKLSVDRLSDAGKFLLDVLCWFSPEAIPESVFDAWPATIKSREGEAPAEPGFREGEAPAEPGFREGEAPAEPGFREGEAPAEPGRGVDSADSIAPLTRLGSAGASPSQNAPSRESLAEENPLAALAELETYSLVKRKREQPTFSVHRLVQATTRYHLQGNITSLLFALKWLNQSFIGDPQDVRNWPVLEPLQTHVDHICAYADQYDLVQQEHPTSRLLTVSAMLSFMKAKHEIAEPLYRRALAIDEAELGIDHYVVATDLNNLAQLLQETNRLAEAEPLMRRALEIDEGSLGMNHSNVARDLNNLAQLLQDTNRMVEAGPLMRRGLRIEEINRGENHPLVAVQLNNLAQLLQNLNRVDEAEPMMERALKINEDYFGVEHPDYGLSLWVLAGLYHQTHRVLAAEPLLRQAVDILEKSLGKEHPRSQKVKQHYEILLQEMKDAGE